MKYDQKYMTGIRIGRFVSACYPPRVDRSNSELYRMDPKKVRPIKKRLPDIKAFVFQVNEQSDDILSLVNDLGFEGCISDPRESLVARIIDEDSEPPLAGLFRKEQKDSCEELRVLDEQLWVRGSESTVWAIEKFFRANRIGYLLGNDVIARNIFYGASPERSFIWDKVKVRFSPKNNKPHYKDYRSGVVRGVDFDMNRDVMVYIFEIGKSEGNLSLEDNPSKGIRVVGDHQVWALANKGDKKANFVEHRLRERKLPYIRTSLGSMDPWTFYRFNPKGLKITQFIEIEAVPFNGGIEYIRRQGQRTLNFDPVVSAITNDFLVRLSS